MRLKMGEVAAQSLLLKIESEADNGRQMSVPSFLITIGQCN